MRRQNQITISQLCGKGDPRDTTGWREGNPDYVSDFGLNPGHIQTLIEIAWKWTESDELAEDEWAAPIHAWRALGQLRAVEAVEPLLNMQNRLDESGDDWYLEEFHDVSSESAEVIERAFAAGLVDETVCGDWTTIRQELGVAGLGLVPDRPRPPRPHFGLAGTLGDPVPVDRLDRDRRRQSDKRAKAKRKQQKQARKRNRKRR